MTRILDANAMMAGAEPKYNQEITKIQLIGALNWYTQNRASKDAQKYASDYFKKKFKVDASEILKEQISTLGFLCKIVSNGATLPKENQSWFEKEIERIKTLAKKPKVKAKVVDPVATAPTLSIQERMAEKISEVAGELEGLLDDYVESGLKIAPSPYSILHSKGAKGAYASKIIEIWKKKRNEYEEALSGRDDQLAESYAHFKKTGLKKLIAYCDQVITDCMKLSEESVKTRKPRKRKVKSADELVAKVKYCEKFDELKLVSQKPKDIIGATQIWVYNTKYRKLGCYHADDAGGFSVKGTTILNFSEMKSVQKKLRKPEVSIPEVLKGGKVTLRNFLANIRAVESPLTGRLNEDTILLRIIK
jgi:hypothetical protein